MQNIQFNKDAIYRYKPTSSLIKLASKGWDQKGDYWAFRYLEIITNPLILRSHQLENLEILVPEKIPQDTPDTAEKIQEDTMQDIKLTERTAQDIKLEMGQAYKAEGGEIFVIVADMTGRINTDYPYLGYHYNRAYQFNEKGDGYPQEYQNKTLRLVKKYAEPFKNKLVKYFTYSDNTPDLIYITDELTNTYADGFFQSYLEALKYKQNMDNQKIGKIIMESVAEYDVEE